MKNIWKRPHGRRVCSLLLVLALTIGLLPVLRTDADAAGEKITLFHWKQVFTQSDLPQKGKILLFWTSSGTTYCTSGSKNDEYGLFNGWDRFVGVDITTLPGVDPTMPEFYTKTDCACWSISTSSGNERDDDNKDSTGLGLRQYYFYRNDGKILNVSGLGNLEWGGTDLWGVATSNSAGCKYQQNTAYGYVQIYHNVTGFDDYFKYDGKYLLCDKSDTYNYPDFKMFIGKEEEFNQLDDYTVQAGATFHIGDNTILPSGKKLTVEPGGTVIVSGRFINNGSIENYGSLIVESGACITACTAVDSNADCTIRCHGSTIGYTLRATGEAVRGAGSIYIAKTGCISTTQYGGFSLLESASCAVDGLLVVPTNIQLEGAEIFTGKNGSVFFGFELPADPASAIKYGVLAEKNPLSWELIVEPSYATALGPVQSHLKGRGKFYQRATLRGKEYFTIG